MGRIRTSSIFFAVMYLTKNIIHVFYVNRSDIYRELLLCKLLAAPLELNTDRIDYWDPFGDDLASSFVGPSGISRHTYTSGTSDLSTYDNETENNYEESFGKNNEYSTTNSNQSSGETVQTINESVSRESSIKSIRRRSREYSKYFKTRRLSMFEGLLPKLNDDTNVNCSSPLNEQTSYDESNTQSENNSKIYRRQSEPIKSFNYQYYHYAKNDTFKTIEHIQHHLKQLNLTNLNSSKMNFTNSSIENKTKFNVDDNHISSMNNAKSILSDEIDIKNVFHQIQAMEERQNIPMQKLKELLLSSRDGMKDFMAFLVTTNGIHLVDFWLDCETIKMISSTETNSCYNSIKMKFDLIRDLEDRYLLRLTAKARQQLFTSINTISEYLVSKCSNNNNNNNNDPNESYLCQLGNMMFDCVQYDCLRRLRYYWLPRWLLHWERIIRDCQFLPSNCGGSGLFYLPSRCSSIIRTSSNVNTENLSINSSDIEPENHDDDDDDDDDNGESHAEYEEVQSNEVFRGDDDDDDDDDDKNNEDKHTSMQLTHTTFTMSNDEKSWNQEIYDTVIKNALTRNGLIKSEQNKEILRNTVKQRLKLKPPSTLTSSSVNTSRTMTQFSRLSNDTTNLLNQYSIHSKTNLSLFNRLNVSWTIPLNVNDTIGLKQYPGFKWNLLKVNSSIVIQQQMKTLMYNSNEKTSLIIDSFISTLGLNNNNNNEYTTDILLKSSLNNETLLFKNNLSSDKMQLINKESNKQQKVKESSLNEQNFNGISSMNILKKKCLAAIHADASSGGPFQAYLERNGHERQNRMLGFLQTLHDYSRQNLSSMANRFTKLTKIWYIVNHFLRSNSRWSINIDSSLLKSIIEVIQSKRETTPVQLFDSVKSICLNEIYTFWIDYLKYDAFQFVHPLKSTSSNQLKRSNSWDNLTPSEKEEHIRMKLEQARITEKERRKAVLAARKRQRDALKSKKQDSTLSGLIKITESDEETGIIKQLDNQTEVQSKRKSTQLFNLKSMIDNKLLISMFQEWLKTTLNKSSLHHNALNHLAFILDVNQYLTTSINQLNIEKLKYKISKAGIIYDNYLRVSCKKPIEVPVKFAKRLDQEKDRPTSATLKGLQNYHLNNLYSLFNDFLNVTAKKLGLSVIQLCQMPEIELAPLVETPKTQSQTKKTKQKFSIKMRPMLEDKEELTELLKNAAFQTPNFKLILFYQYLVDYGSKENCPFIDQDLIFHIEILRFE
ncbi:Regulator of G- signaling 22, partial [Schistosoma japonicum]